MALILMVLGAFAAVASSFGAVERKSRDKDALLEACLLGLQRVAGELKSATSILEPTSGSSSRLRFQRTDPTVALFPASPEPSSEPYPFDPFTPATGTAEYRVENRILLRVWTPPSAPAVTRELAGGLGGFGADFINSREMRVSLTILDGAGTRTVSRIVALESVP